MKVGDKNYLLLTMFFSYWAGKFVRVINFKQRSVGSIVQTVKKTILCSFTWNQLEWDKFQYGYFPELGYLTKHSSTLCVAQKFWKVFCCCHSIKRKFFRFSAAKANFVFASYLTLGTQRVSKSILALPLWNPQIYLESTVWKNKMFFGCYL